MIKGGYILQPRVIDQSWFSKVPPHVREIWMFLLRKANHAAKQTSGITLQRGQLHTSYSIIIEALSWYVGYRKEKYKKHHCETAMKLLVRENMITTKKTTRGIIVTICNYEYYQNPKNYETDIGTDNETCKKPAMNRQDKQECKNEKEVNRVIPPFEDFLNYATKHKPEIDPKALELKYKAWFENGWKDGNDKPVKNWKSKLLNTIPHIPTGKKQHKGFKNDFNL